MLSISDAASQMGAISSDGRYVVFSSPATTLVTEDTNGVSDVFLRDLLSGYTIRASVGAAQGNGASAYPSVNATGQYVAFSSAATNFVSGDTNARSDIFVRDMVFGTLTRASITSGGTQPNADCINPRLNANGRIVAFESSASNLTAGDSNAATDVFVANLQTGDLTRVSEGGNAASSAPAIDTLGRYVAFESLATNLVAGDSNGRRDVFVRDTFFPQTFRASVDASGTQANGDSWGASVSGDGRYVVFASDATNLLSGDTNAKSDIFLKDLQTGEVTRLSTSATGTQANDASSQPSISSDGRYVTFRSLASNLVTGDTNGVEDIFVKDRITGAITRVSTTSSGAESDGGSLNPAISGDGQIVAFASMATNLVPSDTNGVNDIFARNLASGPLKLVSQSGQPYWQQDLIVDFGSAGLWAYKDNSTWQNLHNYNVKSVVAGDLDGNGLSDLVVDFGAGVGLFTLTNSTTWTRLHTYTADQVVIGHFFAGSSRQQVVVDFGPADGLWAYDPASGYWMQLHPLSPDSMTVADIDGNGVDDLIVDFGTNGLYAGMNLSNWVSLHKYNPRSVTAGDLDGNGKADLVVDFGPGVGLYVDYNNSGFQLLHTYSAEGIVTGDINADGCSEVIVNFGLGVGLWIYRPADNAWQLLHSTIPESVTPADVDGNGLKDLACDFGSSGTFFWMNNSSWVFLHPYSPDSITAAELNGLATLSYGGFTADGSDQTSGAAASSAAVTDQTLLELLAMGDLPGSDAAAEADESLLLATSASPGVLKRRRV